MTFTIWLSCSFIGLFVSLIFFRIMKDIDELDLDDEEDVKETLQAVAFVTVLGPISLTIISVIVTGLILYRLFIFAMGGRFLSDSARATYSKWMVKNGIKSSDEETKIK